MKSLSELSTFFKNNSLKINSWENNCGEQIKLKTTQKLKHSIAKSTNKIKLEQRVNLKLSPILLVDPGIYGRCIYVFQRGLPHTELLVAGHPVPERQGLPQDHLFQ